MAIDWGVTGCRPGPALVAIGLGKPPALVFVAAIDESTKEIRMRSQGENLVKMANQIGIYFASQHGDDDDAAAQAVAAHLKSFWAPPMRQGLIALQQQPGGSEMLPIVRRALTAHHAALTSASVRVGGEESEVYPAGGGDAG